MRNRAVFAAAVAVGLAIVIGCGPERRIPSKDSGSADTGKSSGPSLPTASHPEAQKVVDRAIHAATEGDPKRLDKAWVNKSVVKGVVEWPGPVPGSLVTIKANRTIQAVWPDRIRVTMERPSEEPRQVVLGRRPLGFWAYNVDAAGKATPVTLPDAREEESILRVDAVGQHWLLLLVPLTDPKAVVFDARKVPVAADVTADLIKLSIPDYPVFDLWFNEKTGLLGRLEYTHNERGNSIRKSLVVTNHKPHGGIVVPTTIVFQRNDRTVEQWTLESWEFPEKLGEPTFDPPK